MQTSTSFQMNKNTKTFGYKIQKIRHSFTGTKLTQYVGLSVIMKFINKKGIGKELNTLFPTIKHNPTKFGNSKVLLSILL